MQHIDERFADFLASVKPYNDTSQFCEDSAINAIFKRIGTANRWICECGAGDGLFFSNSYSRVRVDWSAVLIEQEGKSYQRLLEIHGSNPRVHLFQVLIDDQCNFDVLLEESGAPIDLDLLVCDVDGQDYWHIARLSRHQPRVLMVEYDPNAEPDFIPEPNGPGQAGLAAIIKLGCGKLYTPVCRTYCNVIFVRNDLASMLMEAPKEEAPRERIIPQPKEHGDQRKIKIAAAMSTPRLGFLSNSDCILAALAQFNIPLARGEGAFWHAALTRSIESCLKYTPDYVLTIDYDTAFNSADVAKLVCFLDDNPGIDVVVPMQQKREGGELLASSDGAVDLSQAGIPIRQGHFGLTLFRANVFERISKPWFFERPGPDGRWDEGRTDADMGFWENCRNHGIRTYLALNVVVGHLELVNTWPDQQLKPYRQTLNDWRGNGQKAPAEAFNRERITETVEHIRSLEMKD